MKGITLLSILSFLAMTLLSQTTRLSGFVYDELNKESLIGASVFNPESGKGTVTNSYGYYTIMVDISAQGEIQISFTGYLPLRMQLKDIKKAEIDFYLKPGISLTGVNIVSEELTSVNKTTETGTIRLSIREIKKIPNLFGEVDIIKAFQMTPGVQSGGEAKSEMYVRGGSPDQNLIILDDVPLYYVAHFGGFLSVFNADAISDVKLIKSGFPARYGGRLSSVFDVRMKEGNMEKFAGQGSLGLLSSKLLLEGPAFNGKSSFMISARRNTLPLLRLMGTGIGYNFHDLNAKFNYKLTDRDRLFFSFYQGNDAVSIKNKTYYSNLKSTVSWGNLAGAVRYNKIVNDKIFTNLVLAVSQYQYSNKLKNEIESDSTIQIVNNQLTSKVRDLLFKAEVSYSPLANYRILSGYSGILHHISPNDEVYDAEFNDKKVHRNYSSGDKSLENAFFTEHEISLNNFSINAGLRIPHMYVDKTSYLFAEPRINTNIPLNQQTSVKLSYAVTNQFMHLLSYSGTGIPNDYWMPSTGNIKPGRSAQYSLSFARSFNSKNIELSVETYYKELSGLIAFRPGYSLTGAFSSWESVVVSNGKGINYGVEFFLQKTKGRSTGWAGLTIADATRKFNELNGGKAFPFKYNRLLDINLVWNYEISAKIIVSATWTYGSGYPVTIASKRIDLEGQEVFVYDEINSFHMRDYHRMDVAVNFPAKTRWGERVWTISIYNVYNRKNPYYYYYDRKILGYNEVTSPSGFDFEAVYDNLKLYQKSLFGFFPSFGYSFKF
ncbi:MAG: TonB-dependent receptor [Lentimicrobium sp.]|nr:TonB-dependent receptor [Lentimicrobium sp.]